MQVKKQQLEPDTTERLNSNRDSNFQNCFNDDKKPLALEAMRVLILFGKVKLLQKFNSMPGKVQFGF